MTYTKAKFKYLLFVYVIPDNKVTCHKMSPRSLRKCTEAEIKLAIDNGRRRLNKCFAGFYLSPHQWSPTALKSIHDGIGYSNRTARYTYILPAPRYDKRLQTKIPRAIDRCIWWTFIFYLCTYDCTLVVVLCLPFFLVNLYVPVFLWVWLIINQTHKKTFFFLLWVWL